MCCRAILVLFVGARVKRSSVSCILSSPQKLSFVGTMRDCAVIRTREAPQAYQGATNHGAGATDRRCEEPPARVESYRIRGPITQARSGLCAVLTPVSGALLTNLGLVDRCRLGAAALRCRCSCQHGRRWSRASVGRESARSGRAPSPASLVGKRGQRHRNRDQDEQQRPGLRNYAFVNHRPGDGP